MRSMLLILFGTVHNRKVSTNNFELIGSLPNATRGVLVLGGDLTNTVSAPSFSIRSLHMEIIFETFMLSSHGLLSPSAGV